MIGAAFGVPCCWQHSLWSVSLRLSVLLTPGGSASCSRRPAAAIVTGEGGRRVFGGVGGRDVGGGCPRLDDPDVDPRRDQSWSCIVSAPSSGDGIEV